MFRFLMDPSWLLTFLVGFLTWYLVRKWLKIRSLPPGPFPLPIVGNLLSFRNANMDEVISRWRSKYGDILTVWMGRMPCVVVCEQSLIKEALLERRNDFAGRLQFRITELFIEGNISITNSDYSQPWETLRKMGHAAIRKYAISERLPPLVDDLTEETVKNMLKATEPFHPKDHIYLLTYNIMASSVVGQRYQVNDPEFIAFKNSNEFFEEFANNGLIADFIPLLRPFNSRNDNKFRAIVHDLKSFIGGKIKQHIDTYQNGDIRDMIDSLLSAREEMIAEGRENAAHLHDRNLFQAIMDIFAAGVDTTSITVRWLLLFLAKLPDLQNRVIEEIRDKIGDRVPVQEDKNLCPLTSAVITEILRIRAIAPFGLPHSTTRDTNLGGYTLRKGTFVLFNFGAVHNDPLQWKEPERFYPERFLEKDGTLTDGKLSQYLPFGQGRRSCVGEKLALANMFMVVVGILRRCRLVLKDPPTDFETDKVFFQMPKKHTMLAVPHQK